MYYKIDITCTGKNGKEGYFIFDTSKKYFKTPEEVKNWLKEQYGNCKKVPMYRDKKGKSVKVGYIYCFKNADWSHSPVQHWYQRDWVEVKEVQEEVVLV